MLYTVPKLAWLALIPWASLIYFCSSYFRQFGPTSVSLLFRLGIFVIDELSF